jgi:hypothetical protein
MPGPWVVPQYNRTKEVKSLLSNGGPYDQLDYGSFGRPDPAVGCGKDFVTKYQCGVGDMKTITVPRPGYGEAKYNCKTESTKCNDLQLNLDDSGVLTITNSAKTKTFWTSSVMFPIDDPSKTVPVDVWNPKSQNYGGKVFTGAVRSYLKPGEFLAKGEYIGSPSGKYQLLMTAGALRLNYKSMGCNVPNSSSFRINTITPSPPSTVGQLAYVNNTGQLLSYPAALTTYIAAYESVGPYDLSVSADLTTATIAADANACKTRCSASGQQCAGIIYDKSDSKCHLKDNSIYTAKRILSNTKEYHMRLKDAKGTDDSCPNLATNLAMPLPISGKRWTAMTPGSAMTATTKCGLAVYAASEQRAVDTANNSLATSLNNLKGTSDNISGKLTSVKSKLGVTMTELAAKLTNFKDYQKEKDFTGEQLKQLEAMAEDSELNMLSQNYHHILWSILAIMIVLGIIKFSRTSVVASA